jgi:hypothetical protein
VVPEFGRAGRSVGYGWSAVATRPTMRAGRDVREEVGTPSFTPASLFVALVLLYFQPIARSLDSTAECRTPFREPLQFIVIAVMGVMSGTFPDTNGVFYVTVNRWCIRGPSRHRHGERHGETPYLSGLLAVVTEMTLMTMIYGLILDSGGASTS